MKKKLSKYRKYLLLSVIFLGGCFQASNTDDCDLRTVPVTNNPNVMGNPTSAPAVPY